MNPRPLQTWIGFLVGTAGLLLQFALSIPIYLQLGRDLPGAFGTFFAFYTILTNMVLVLIYLSAISAAAWLELFRRPVVRAMMVANIALVLLFVHFVLSKLYALEGLPLLADTLLHYLAPVLYIIWWLFSQRHGALRWADLPLMLAPAVIYFVYIMARGAWVLEYPYPVFDTVKLGYGPVLLNAAYMAIGLGALCAIVIAADQLLARQQAANG